MEIILFVLSSILGFVSGYLVNRIFKDVEEAKTLWRNMDKFEAYLGDVSDILQCLTKESANDFTYARLQELLLDRNTRDIAQILVDSKVTERTSKAMKIVEDLGNTIRQTNNIRETDLNKLQIHSIRSRIIRERVSLTRFRDQIHIPTWYESESFELFLGGTFIVLIIIIVISFSA